MTDSIVPNCPELLTEAQRQQLERQKARDKRQSRERGIVRGLIRHMKRNGWNISTVWDGEEDTKVATETAALELIFDLDLSRLYLENAAGAFHSVVLVQGNGEDIISDWTYSDGDPDAFDKLMSEYLDTLS